MSDQQGTNSQGSISQSKFSLIRQVTHETLASLSDIELQNPAVVEGQILDNVLHEMQLINVVREKGTKWKIPDVLCPSQIADILLYIYDIVLIVPKKNADTGMLGVYQEDGPDKGLYAVGEDTFHKLALDYNYVLSTKEFLEVMEYLRIRAEKVMICDNPDLIAVNNGIFDYRQKILLPFDKQYVFTAKSRVDYVDNPVNPVLHNPDDGTDWDVESWMKDLSDDHEVVESLWEILGAIIRPNVPWGKSAWFYSESGNNGKGTLCELMRELCGETTYASVPLSDFSKDFMLEPLTQATAIIVDENDVGTYIDKAANLKAVVTGDVIQINRKFKSPIAYRFKGFMVQCLNEMPKIRDKSDSFYRRQLFIPFTKCFTGAERKYIKHDYLHRQDVLRYVLHRVLHMDYYELQVPDSCKRALEEYKEFNDPLRQFVNEIFPDLQWNLIPFSFLYDLYGAWYKKNVGKGETISRQTFVKNIVLVLGMQSEFVCEDKTKKYRPGTQMDKAEPLIAEYDLKDWMNPMMSGSHDIEKRCHPVLKANYKGLIRKP